MRFYLCHKENDPSRSNWYCKNDRGDRFSGGDVAYVDKASFSAKRVVVEREISESDVPRGATVHWIYSA